MFTSTISKLNQNPKRLFILDALGALLSAFLLGVVLVHYESVFGIPKECLYLLATIPCFFAVYDLVCYLSLKSNYGIYLKTIATLNIAYCLFSLYVAFQHKEQLLTFGWIYILAEIGIVVYLALIEWQAGKEA